MTNSGTVNEMLSLINDAISDSPSDDHAHVRSDTRGAWFSEDVQAEVFALCADAGYRVFYGAKAGTWITLRRRNPTGAQ